MKTITQLPIIGLSDDQLYFNSSKWGVVKYIAADNYSQKKRCQHCLLFNNKTRSCTHHANEVCCTSENRKDSTNGYYTIRQFPTL